MAPHRGRAGYRPAVYTPSRKPGLIVEHRFDETLLLIRSRWNDLQPGEDYIYVDWGPGFYVQHAQSCPDLERPPQNVNIGWLGVQLILTNGGGCFLPARMAEPFVASGRLYRVLESPEYV